MKGAKLSERERLVIGPFLTLLRPSQLSLITIMEVLRLHGSGGVAEGMKTARALITVGAAVELEFSAALRKREMSRRHNLEKFYKSNPETGELESEEAGIRSDGAQDGLEGINKRREAAKKDAEVETASTPGWSRAIQAKVGSLLVDALMDTATVVRSVETENGEI